MFLPAAGVLALGMVFSRYNYLPISYIQIYDDSDIDSNLQVTFNASSYGRYLIPSSYSEVDEFFNIDPELAVKTKARRGGTGAFYIQAYSDYVRDVRDLNNTVDILMYVKVERTTHTFPISTPSLQNWQALPQEMVGTHYVKSLKYGDYAFGYIRLKPRGSRYLGDLKSAVGKYFGKRGNLNDLKEESFDKFEKEVEFKYLTEKSSFQKSSLDFMGFAFTAKSIWQMATKFQKSSEESNEKGTPVAMELADLSIINDKYTEFQKNPALDPVLSEVNEKYDDLRVANKRYYDINYEILKTCTDQQQILFKDHQEKMEQIYYGLMEAVQNLDITKSTQQLDKAIEMYGSQTDNRKYNKQLDELIDRTECLKIK